MMSIIRKAVLPNSITGKSEIADRRQRSEPLGFEFDEGFVKDFMKHRVPVLRSLLLATHSRPQMQDCMFFLIWRSYSAATTSFIPWEGLRDQFWQADSNKARIRLRFKEAISLLKSSWPELIALAGSQGLVVGPPKNGVQFVPVLSESLHVRKERHRKWMESKCLGNDSRSPTT